MIGLLALGLPAVAAEVAQSWPLDDDGGLTPTEGIQWEWGAPSTGPVACASGDACWGTRLDRFYLNDAEDHLRLPSQDLAGLAAPVVSWWQWLAIADGDVAQIQIEGEDGWVSAAPIYGYPSGDRFETGDGQWHQVFVDLSGLDDLSRVRLSFIADATVPDDGWFVDDLVLWDGDAAPPEIIALDLLGDTTDVEGPYLIEAEAIDDQEAPALSLFYSVDGGEEVALEMAGEGDGAFAAEIPGQDPDSVVAYRIEATDGENVAYAPDAPHGFRVYLPAPGDLSAPGARLAGVEVELTWSAPETDRPIAGYALYRDGAIALEIDGDETSASAPIEASGAASFSVAARFEIDGAVWTGDASEPLELALLRSDVVGLEPAEAFQGDAIRVWLTGANLLLADGEVAATLGEGISIDAIDVLDVDRAELSLTLDEGAAVGDRDLSLSSGGIALSVPGLFTVLDGADRPRLVSITPEAADQGESLEAEICASEAMNAPPTLDLGEGVVVGAVSLSGDALCASAELFIDPGAPIGERAISADDGVRVLDGIGFEVEDYFFVPEPSCASGPRGGGWLGILLAGGLARRRTRRRGAGRGAGASG